MTAVAATLAASAEGAAATAWWVNTRLSAAEVDPIGAGGPEPACLVEDRGQWQPRRVVDLGNDLDVEATVADKIP